MGSNAAQQPGVLHELPDELIEAAVFDALVDYVRERGAGVLSAPLLWDPLAKLVMARVGSMLTPPRAVLNHSERIWPIERVLAMLAAQGHVVPCPSVRGNRLLEWAEVQLTSTGLRFLSREPPNPLAPDYLTAIGSTGVPETAMDRLQDAVDCWRAHLLRPAIVMLGVAYEDVTMGVLDLLRKSDQGAQTSRIDWLLKRLTESLPANDARGRELAALAEARALNERRNAGAHPRRSPPTRAEVDAHLRVAPIYLPLIHGLATRLSASP